jgi:hypothetical protein
MMTRTIGLIVVLAGAVAGHAAAQGVGFEVLGSVEGSKTDAGSRLLALNDGHPVMTSELYGWFAWQPSRTVRIMALGEAYAVTGDDHELDADLQLLSVRWWRSRALRIEAGRIVLPIGEFASRRFANVNPLIGTPDTYVSEYPWGGSLSGAVGPVDYVAAAISLPAVNERYTPAPSARLRPVIGAGVSIGPQLRVGVAATHGPYLSSDLSAQIPVGTAWQDFAQTVVTTDLRYSVGRTETRGEAAWSSYQVPTVAEPVHGFGWYLESRIAITPRLFAAARYEDNRYPFVQPVSPAFWVGAATTQMNGEVGLGYRASADALIKASLRRDHWPVHSVGDLAFPDGYAFAVQFSLHADVVQLLTRKP